MTKIELMTDMMTASHHLTVGLAGVVHKVLPEKDRYKVEVLLEAYTDTLRGLSIDINDGEKE